MMEGLDKAGRVAALRKELLALQGFRSREGNAALDGRLAPLLAAFPEQQFPTGAVHEFISGGVGEAAASSGFVSVLMGGLMQTGAAGIWISTARRLFPPALQAFGVSPHRVVFIDLKKKRDLLWAAEEALRCPGLATVVAEIDELDFTQSRRLQLAVEQSRVTGFLLRTSAKRAGVTTSVSRWRIRHLPSDPGQHLPGVGFPRWKVDLEKIRNGRPQSWELEWSGKELIPLPVPAADIQEDLVRQTG